MIINNAVVTTIEELESSIKDMDLPSQQMLRSIWEDEFKVLSIQQAKREFGQKHINSLIDKMGERNQILINSGISVNVMGIASDNAGLKLLIETGAVGNAITVCGMLKYKYPTHKDIYEDTISEFTRESIAKGWPL